jgi:hypothetical protein
VDYTSRSHEQIELRAYQFWEDRGRPCGTPQIDWFRAEQELAIIEPEGVLLRVAREVGSAVGNAVAFLTDVTLPLPKERAQ